eukprot:402591-Rhodomonas_salina.1
MPAAEKRKEAVSSSSAALRDGSLAHMLSPARTCEKPQPAVSLSRARVFETRRQPEQDKKSSGSDARCRRRRRRQGQGQGRD